jgi:UDP-3-O-[3-hydroxymyristoyl] glucosamine N-acyltransferase
MDVALGAPAGVSRAARNWLRRVRVGVRLGQRVCVGRGVLVGLRVFVAEGTFVGVAEWTDVELGLGVCVNVLLGVRVGQWVSLGRGVALGTRLAVNDCAGMGLRFGIAEASEVRLGVGGTVGVWDGRLVAVWVDKATLAGSELTFSKA